MNAARFILLLPLVLLAAAAQAAGDLDRYSKGGCGSRTAYAVLRYYGLETTLEETASIIDDEGATSLRALRALLHERGLYTVIEKFSGNIVTELCKIKPVNGRRLCIAACLEPGANRAHSIILAWDRYPHTLAWIDPNLAEVSMVAKADRLIATDMPLLVVSDRRIDYVPRHRRLTYAFLSLTLGLGLGMAASPVFIKGVFGRCRFAAGLPLACAFAVCTAAGNVSAAVPAEAADHRITGQLSLDLGEHKVGSRVKCTFTLTNNTDRTMSIEKIVSTYTCAAPSASMQEIPPNETVEITTEYSVSSLGFNASTLYVHLDDPIQPVVPLTIQCVGTQSVQLPRHLHVGTLSPGETIERRFVIRSPRDGQDMVREIRLLSKDLRVECDMLAKIETREWDLHQARIMVAAEEWTPGTRIMTAVGVIGIDDGGIEVHLGEIGVSGEILDAYYAEPSAVFLGDAIADRETLVEIALTRKSGIFGEVREIATSGACREVRIVSNDKEAGGKIMILTVIPDRIGYFVGSVSLDMADAQTPLVVKVAGKAGAPEVE